MDLFADDPQTQCPYSYLWHRGGEPEVQRFRHSLQSWFEALDNIRYKEELKSKLSGNGAYGAFFELFCYHWFTSRGFRLSPQDHLPGKTADFLVSDDQGNGLFYLECTVISDSKNEERKEGYIDAIVGRLNNELPEGVGVFIEFGDIDTQPALRPIVSFVRNHIDEWKRQGCPENQKFSYRQNGVNFRIRFSHSQSSDLSYTSNSQGYGTESEKIIKHIRDKISKAGNSGSLPFVIASNLAGDFGRGHCIALDGPKEFAMQQVFLGSYSINMDTGEGRHDLKRTFWFDAGGNPINTTVSAIFYFANVRPDNAERCGFPVIWQHPYAQKPLQTALFNDVAQWVYNEDKHALQLIGYSRHCEEA